MTSTTSLRDWETYLTGATPCRFPRFGRPTEDAGSDARQTASVQVKVAEAERLLGLSATDADGLGAVLRTAWALLLRCYSGQDELVFGFSRPGGDAVARFLLDDSVHVAAVVENAKTDLPGDLPPVPDQLIRSGDSGLPLFDTAVVLWNSSETSGPHHVLAPVRIANPLLQSSSQIRWAERPRTTLTPFSFV